ncbi:RND transporter [Fuscovulum blasticum]|uniref:RND transporter n=1 Tax=Fuscovulum blasticum TaxID=1075 RepID=UPI000F4DB549|nr:RND transporter [Fuscovulum blasticum]
MSLLDQTPLTLFVLAALTLGLAPFFPEPHIWEKLKMLMAGTLVRPLDMFDLALHALPWVALLAKLARMVWRGQGG